MDQHISKPTGAMEAGCVYVYNIRHTTRLISCFSYLHLIAR